MTGPETAGEEAIMGKIYDVVILGAGPGGLSAGLYAGRSCLSTLIIERGVDGGQIASTDEIENYPGQLPEGETGTSLAERMARQCEKFGCERVMDTVTGVELEGEVKKITCAKGTYEARAVIIATGANSRPIDCKGEKEFVGRGVSYCATCDANFFRGLEVFVVGGGDSAVEEAIYLTKRERLRLSTEEMNCVRLNPSRKKPLKMTSCSLCGTRLLQSWRAGPCCRKWSSKMSKPAN